MSEATFMCICNKLHPTIEKQVCIIILFAIIIVLLCYTSVCILLLQVTQLSKPVSVEEWVAVTIWKLATNIEYRTLASLFGFGWSTVGKIVVETSHTISTHLLPKYVKIPDGDKLKDIIEGFETCWGFPQAAGAIDGSHIPIIRPDESASNYYNRKGYYVIMQAMVDFRGLFMDVYIGWPGKVHGCKGVCNSSLYYKGMCGTLFPDWKRTICGTEVIIIRK